MKRSITLRFAFSLFGDHFADHLDQQSIWSWLLYMEWHSISINFFHKWHISIYWKKSFICCIVTFIINEVTLSIWVGAKPAVLFHCSVSILLPVPHCFNYQRFHDSCCLTYSPPTVLFQVLLWLALRISI